MEYLTMDVNHKSANFNFQLKGAPNPFERHLNEDPYKVSVTRKIYPGDAAPGPTGSLPLRTGWPADGKFVKGSGWHTGAASPPQSPPHVKKTTYAWQHNQFVRPSA